MDIYKEYERRGIKDYKLRDIKDLKELHNIELLKIENMDKLNDKEQKEFIRLFIGFLNGFGCRYRSISPLSVERVREDKYKVIFEDGGFSYLYTNGTVG